MHLVCENKYKLELLKLLLEAKLVDQEMLKIPNEEVRIPRISNTWFLVAFFHSYSAF